MPPPIRPAEDRRRWHDERSPGAGKAQHLRLVVRLAIGIAELAGNAE